MHTPIEVTHLNPYRIGIKGGVEAYLYVLLPSLAKYGINANCFVGGALKTHSPLFQEYRSYLDLGKNDRDLDRFIKDCTLALKNSLAIHFHNLHIFSTPGKITALYYELRNKYPQAKLFLHLHNLSNDSKSWDIIRLFGVQHVVSYSEFVAREVYRLTGFFPDILPPCFLFPTANTRKKQHLHTYDILQPTRFHPDKGPHISLVATTNLLEKGFDNFTFTQAGVHLNRLQEKWNPMWDKQFPGLFEKVQYYNTIDKIRFEEFNYYDMAERISKADIILHPSIGKGVRGEAFSIATAQAIIAGKPIIVSNSGNLPRLANPKEYTSIITEAGNNIMLEESLERWLIDSIPKPTEKSQNYSLLIRRQAEGAVKRHIEFYEKVLEKKLL